MVIELIGGAKVTQQKGRRVPREQQRRGRQLMQKLKIYWKLDLIEEWKNNRRYV